MGTDYLLFLSFSTSLASGVVYSSLGKVVSNHSTKRKILIMKYIHYKEVITAAVLQMLEKVQALETNYLIDEISSVVMICSKLYM